jgi:hypothetical protein
MDHHRLFCAYVEGRLRTLKIVFFKSHTFYFTAGNELMNAKFPRFFLHSQLIVINGVHGVVLGQQGNKCTFADNISPIFN